MNPASSVDFEALIRVLIGLGTGLIVAVISSVLFKIKRGRQIILGLGVALVVAALLFYVWPSLVEVPDLANLSNAEAEDILRDRGLVPEDRPQASETEKGRVVPYSQEPSPNFRVRKGTIVRFAVSQGSQVHIVTPQTETTVNVSISIFRPKSGNVVKCTRYPDKIYRFAVDGTSNGLSQNFKLLLWVRPVNPPSETPGWYLQRPPINGITQTGLNGSWKGVGQIGNAQWPPYEGDIFDIAVTVAESETANSLLGKIGVIVRDEPIGIKSDIALSVIVTMQ